MNEFQITPNESLKVPISAWYHAEYQSGAWKQTGTIENIICTLKNDIHVKSANDIGLLDAVKSLYNILYADLDSVKKYYEMFAYDTLTICVVPRAKVKYQPHQLLFKKTIQDVVAALNLNDGTDYIISNKAPTYKP